MSPLRFILKDIRLWGFWSRSGIVGTVLRRCKRDRSVQNVIQCFRQAFFSPKRTLLLSATAAFKAHCTDDEFPVKCSKNINDEEIKALLSELDSIQSLSNNTLFCNACGKRCVIDKKIPGVTYCSCKVPKLCLEYADGWIPYMEAEDVIIWRKEYKPGMGLYAYKVYGRYNDVNASDFAAIQLDGVYRRVWDAAVAGLSVVERSVNGVMDQTVLHWEVLWPRLFANRDYVYIRRHKEFEVNSSTGLNIFQSKPTTRTKPIYTERPSVHSNAKRKAMEVYERESHSGTANNKVYIIVSKSCEHPSVPETKHAIRVCEYWSHMVVKTLNGAEKSGMEFVLTYYDEPAVGGMPSTVAAWASGRAAPAYLQRMRQAAREYAGWRDTHEQKSSDFHPFVSKDDDKTKPCSLPYNERDMESSSTGPDLDEESTKDQCTQTEGDSTAQPDLDLKPSAIKSIPQNDNVQKNKEDEKETPADDSDSDKLPEEETQKHVGCDFRNTSASGNFARSQVNGMRFNYPDEDCTQTSHRNKKYTTFYPIESNYETY